MDEVLVTGELAIENIPSVLLDYPTAVRELVRHLVHVHEYRRIAFIRGPAGHPAAEEWWASATISTRALPRRR
jgi:DNA-binding LacI/PurR family transcriptional regulator